MHPPGPQSLRSRPVRFAALGVSLALAAAAVVGAANRWHGQPGVGAERLPATAPAVVTHAPVPLGSAPATATDVSARRPVWSDEFSEPAGASPYGPTWKFATGAGGWGNNELECYTDARDNSALDGAGDLVVTARYEPGHRCADGSTTDYTSARITTQGLRSLRYGHVRVRAQLPTASGTWPAIWALGVDNDQVAYPRAGEIDVAEVVGLSPSVVYGTVHGPSPNGAPYAMSGSARLPNPVSDAFHVFGIDWTPDSIAFSVDDHVYSTDTRAEFERGGQWVFDHPFYLLLDLAVGGDFPGPPNDPGAFPQSMRVDYVRVYS